MTDPFLAGLPAFKKLPGPVLADLSRRLIARGYRKGEAVFEEGAPAGAVYLLRSGLVKAVKFSPKAELASMEIIGPGQQFGMIAVMDDKPYPVSAVPLSASRIYRIPATVFSGLLAAHPEFSKHVFAAVGDHLRQSQDLRSLAGESVERRVAHVLLVLSRSMGAELRVRREDIAEIAGCSAETAIRTIADFRKKRLVATGWKRVTLLDPARLKALTAPR